MHEAGPTLLDVLSGSGRTPPRQSLAEAWGAYAEARARGATPLVAAAVAATEVDRLGFAFAVGYPAALQQLVPGVELRSAFCVTEDGNHPRAMQTTLEGSGDGFVLEGHKSFVTFGTMATTLIVIARRAGALPALEAGSVANLFHPHDE